MISNESVHCVDVQENMKTKLQIITTAPLIVKCQVCRADIEVFVKKSLPNAVKCNDCSKYTPVLKAPLEKEYIRCSSCNYLLLAEKRQTGIRCSKVSGCKKLIRKCQVDCTRWEYSPKVSQALDCECEYTASSIDESMTMMCWFFKGSLFSYVIYRCYIVLLQILSYLNKA